MCRNIRTLVHYEPPATEGEIQAAALQFVRKISGVSKPSRVNERAFTQAVDDVADVVRRLVATAVSNGAPRDRVREAERARARSRARFAPASAAAAVPEPPR
jgi:hypothetical protein